MLYDRAGENSSFCPLNHPYLPRKLKEVAGQCKIYIRPLQKDLVDSDTEEEIEVCSFPLCTCTVGNDNSFCEICHGLMITAYLKSNNVHLFTHACLHCSKNSGRV